MKISVITVCFNAVSTIEKTICSVLNQSWSDLEYIIIDGGSKDGTVDILKKYSSRLSYISEPDKGIYDAMNKGVKKSSGDYVLFLGADDLLFDNEVLSIIANKLLCPDCIYYGDVVFLPSFQTYCGKFNTFKLIRKNICHQAILYPAHILKREPYDLKYKSFADWELNIRLWNRYNFIYLYNTISYFTLGGLSGKGDERFIQARGSIIKKNLGRLYFFYFLARIQTAAFIKSIWA